MPQFGTAQDLAGRLGLTRRRVDQLEETGVVVANAKGVFDLDRNARRYRAFADKDREWVIAEFNRVGDALTAGLEQLRAITSIAKRREVGTEVAGRLIGEFDSIMRLANAFATEGTRPLLDHYAIMNSKAFIAEFFGLLELDLTIRPDDPADTGKRRYRKAAAVTGKSL